MAPFYLLKMIFLLVVTSTIPPPPGGGGGGAKNDARRSPLPPFFWPEVRLCVVNEVSFCSSKMGNVYVVFASANSNSI